MSKNQTASAVTSAKHSATPFACLWAKTAPAELFRSRESVFSESVGGLANMSGEIYISSGHAPETTDTSSDSF